MRTKIIISSLIVLTLVIIIGYLFLYTPYKETQLSIELIEKEYNSSKEDYEWSIAKNEAFLKGEPAPPNPYDGSEGWNYTSLEAGEYGVGFSKVNFELNSWYYEKLKEDKENPKVILLAEQFSSSIRDASSLIMLGMHRDHNLNFESKLLFNRIETITKNSIDEIIEEDIEKYLSGMSILINNVGSVYLAETEKEKNQGVKESIHFSDDEITRASHIIIQHLDEANNKIEQYKSEGEYTQAVSYSFYAIFMKEVIIDKEKNAMSITKQKINQTYFCSNDSDCFEIEYCLNQLCIPKDWLEYVSFWSIGDSIEDKCGNIIKFNETRNQQPILYVVDTNGNLIFPGINFVEGDSGDYPSHDLGLNYYFEIDSASITMIDFEYRCEEI